jgi:phosphoserine aminotransferase
MIYTNFTPGPSQLYFTVEDHARHAFKLGIPSISHRSKQFEQISRETTDGLRDLLSIPSDHHIFFTSSATEIWERIIQNLVSERSFHLVNGSFSRRFHEIAMQSGKNAMKLEAAEGNGFDPIIVPPATELLAITHNETSTGVSLPVDTIHDLKKRYPDTLVAVDAVSSLPYPRLDYTIVDTVFFSVQKAFGLPAGLGVWIVNNKCVEKANQLLKDGKNIGTYHNIPSLLSHSQKNQTPETPNVLAIYLLGKVVHDFLRRGVETLRRETDYKAAILYQALKDHPLLNAFVKQQEFQSKTVIVADCQSHTEKLSKHLQQKGMYPGDGYGAFKKTQLRFANFPAHSKEQYELLVDTLATFNG